MKLYKITSPGGCGLYRRICEYPELKEIAKNPKQYTVTECYLNASGQVYKTRSISTTDYSKLVREILGKATVIYYAESSRSMIAYKEMCSYEAAADYLTRPVFKDGTKIDNPQLHTEKEEVGAKYHHGPYITTEEKPFYQLTLEDVKKFEISGDNRHMNALIHLFDQERPEWRQPCFQILLAKFWIEANLNLSEKSRLDDETVFLVPKYIHLGLGVGEGRIEIGRDLLEQQIKGGNNE